MSRNKWSHLLGLVIILAVLIGCTKTETEVVKETVVVEVEKVVKETVQETIIVEGTPEVIEKVVEVEKLVTATPEPAKTGGTFRIAIRSDVTDFDPGRTTTIDFQTLKMQGLWNTLYTWDKDLNMVPDLAESWEVVDPQTFIFHIRKGVKFHTGRELTAEDVKFTFEWMIKEGKVYARELARVVGAAEASEDKTADVTGVKVLDDYTVEVKLTEPWAPWLGSIYVIPIIDKETVDEISQKPIGTGPFMFKEWIPNDRIVLERFEDYWEEGKPYLDRVELRVIPNVATAIANLRAGEIDAILTIDPADVGSFAGSRDFLVYNLPSTDLIMIHEVIDHNPPLQDVHARRALAHCLDKDTINRAVFFGIGQQQWSPIPSSFWAYDPAVEELGYEFSVEKAKAELAQSATPDGFDITYTTGVGSQTGQDVGAIWKSCLDQIGVNLEIEVLDSASWLEKWFSYDYALLFNAGPLPPEPHRGFEVFYTPNIHGSARYGQVAWQNDELWDLMTKAATTVDQAERQEYYTELQRKTIEEVGPIIYLQQNPILSVASAKVQGYDSFNALRLLKWADLRLDN